MRMTKRKGLAVYMAALLVLSGMTVEAEESLQTEDVEVMESVASVSDDSNAADDIASGTDGNITWVIDADGKLTVNGTGDLSGNHLSENFAWRPYCEQIISAEINVTGMTDAAGLFYGCRNMTSVDVSGFDTSNVTNMGYMFFCCNELASVDMSSFDTSNVTNMECMFYCCRGLTSIDVSSFDTSNVTDMSGMFYGCSGLTSVDASNFDTGNVTDMGGMFYDCSGLTSVDISSFDTSNVTSMATMFLGCSELLSVDASSFDTSNVTSMWYMFAHCSGLTSVDVSSFDTSNVMDMECMFVGCSGLTGVDASSFDTSNVTTMGCMFSGCSGLESLDISAFDTSNVTNMLAMFSGCSSLRSLDVSGFDTSSARSMGRMFSGCSSLTSLDVNGFDTSNVTDMGYMFAGCSSLTNLDVSGFNTANVRNMGGMFWNCSSLVNLDVSGFSTGNVVSMALMFHECSSLVSLDVAGFNTANVTNMNAMFAGCSDLTSLDVRGFDTSNVTHMGMMFMDCSGLESVDVGGFDTSNVTSMNAMYSGCSALTDLDISGFNIGNVTEDSLSGSMFMDCNNLVTLQSPCNVNISVLLPVVQDTTWQLPDGTQVTKLPQGLNYSVTLTRISDTPQIITTTPDLNMDDVIRVKYVPYSYTVETNNTDVENMVTFSIVEGRLADGLQIYPATGEIYGVPLEAGEFKIMVMAAYSNPAYLPSYAELTLTVLENTNDNVDVSTDFGYDIVQPVTGFNVDNVSGNGTQTLVSQGEYERFRDVYIDGQKLTEGQDYTSAPGSTRITIMNQTLADVGRGTHTLGIEFRTEDGTLKRAAQNYTISSGSTEDEGDNDNISEDEGDNGNTPEEGDDNGKPSVEVPDSSNDNRNKDDSNNNSTILPATDTPQPDFIIYTVERGDSLWKIAVKFYGQGSSWKRIYKDNAAVIRNPGRIYAGQELVICLAETTGLMPEGFAQSSGAAVLEGTRYKVQKGDSLWIIASRAYGSGRLWNIIYEANRDIIADPERIRMGQVLAIPQR